ncbi:peptidoglycan recognition family protein [Flagellimonas sp. DF-77]|uniref:N-acetylmuramoyl-L-alanine amidase n=1 Tax=Flagellimonas algarum TaxID=3230298 RepID=UPI0033929650
MGIRAAILLLLLLGTIGCKDQLELQEMPIEFDGQRITLTKDYLAQRYGIIQDHPEIEPKIIVLHWTVIPTLEQSYEAFQKPTLPNWRPEIESVSGLNVSAHFLVDHDGTIYRLMPETYMARHVIGLNHCAIGVENVGGAADQPLTAAQVEANIRLIDYLAGKYPIDYLIGHYEYTRFEEHPLWLEIDPTYRTEKTDPGPEFMQQVRAGTQHHQFKPLPKPSEK